MSTSTQQMLSKYLQAEAAILEGKTIAFNGRQVSMENLGEIRKGRQEWERRAAAEQGGQGTGIGGLSVALARFDAPEDR